MCGISGYILRDIQPLSTDLILKMTRIFNHRGPDDEGFTFIADGITSPVSFVTEESTKDIQGIPFLSNQDIPHRIAFGHRRFSIVDITSAGHQPFWSANNQVCVSFNGEIYNYIELKEELKKLGHQFNTDSDTEVIVEAFLAWGCDCFQKFNGFWALSLYDTRSQKLYFSRDRIGKAPLYYTILPQGVFWSSEIKSLLELIPRRENVSQEAIVNFAITGIKDVNNSTMFNEIKTFPSGVFGTVSPSGIETLTAYWELPHSRQKKSQYSVQKALKELEEVLLDSIRLRVRADVDVAFELSGGIDSSLLVGLAAKNEISLKAYTISFMDETDDELKHAVSLVNKYPHLINHHIIHAKQSKILPQLNHFIWLLSEPFHSPNLITLRNMHEQITQEGTRVVITGSAADEMFAGYGTDYIGLYLKYLFSTGQYRIAIQEFLKHSENLSFSDYIRTAILSSPQSFQDFYKKLRSLPPNTDPLLDFSSPIRKPQNEFSSRIRDNMKDGRMNYWMRSGHQTSISIPIETRAPFLDYRIVEQALGLPLEYLIREGWLKWMLRRLGEDFLSPEILWRRKKQGFPFPLKRWLLESKIIFLAILQNTQCPYIDFNKLKENYEIIAHHNAPYLWRLIIIGLWWYRVINAKELEF